MTETKREIQTQTYIKIQEFEQYRNRDRLKQSGRQTDRKAAR